tara:strand:+ start:204 stop:488 length:285 start_codon:yes stop_codon:yes gene_type:complete
MNDSNIKNYNIKVENMKNNQSSINAIKNYINYLNKEFIFIDINNQNVSGLKIWFLCSLDINSSSCEIPIKQGNSKSLDQKQFNSIILELIEIKK